MQHDTKKNPPRIDLTRYVGKHKIFFPNSPEHLYINASVAAISGHFMLFLLSWGADENLETWFITTLGALAAILPTALCFSYQSYFYVCNKSKTIKSLRVLMGIQIMQSKVAYQLADIEHIGVSNYTSGGYNAPQCTYFVTTIQMKNGKVFPLYDTQHLTNIDAHAEAQYVASQVKRPYTSTEMFRYSWKSVVILLTIMALFFLYLLSPLILR